MKESVTVIFFLNLSSSFKFVIPVYIVESFVLYSLALASISVTG